MTKRMLIDATQVEETRVVLTSGTRVEDFDFEVSSRRPLKGNIYLAQVTRVEPSLQAAFVEYGGNRHGFLAFNEIHPDYYRIPMEDREALLAERAEDEIDLQQLATEEELEENGAASPARSDANTVLENNLISQELDIETPIDVHENDYAERIEAEGKEQEDESAADQLASNSRSHKPKRNKRRYKIQEVIARRQIMLVQVVKEERGSKGAALTTFLSLAGRYCVLMPNTPRGGGVSRKIVSPPDRKRLKNVVEGLNLQDGMAVIVRTAGSERTKTEIKRDYEYLIRLWDQIRESTLVSTAPYLVHEEANLIKRSIRDLYTRDIDEILIEGEDGYRLAKSFMKTLMPSHARRVQRFATGGIPLFSKLQVEAQLDYLYEPTVQLRSGGYIVLNQTEALVAVDVNSGRSTRERNIEETALKTNLEAAEEIARQLRLRDLAGLIVIDFIDMYETRNQHTVERKMKDVIKSDRARVQMSKISQFGLMELSRQRLRPSVTEASTQPCPHCSGSGLRRSIDSAALQVLRNIEEEGLRQEASEILIHLPTEVGFYLLNRKREILDGMEKRYGFQIFVEPDNQLIAPEHKIERTLLKAGEDRIQEMAAIAAESDSKKKERDTKASSKKSPGNTKQRKRRNNKSTSRKSIHSTSQIEPDQQGSEASNIGNSNIDEDDMEKRKKRRGKRGGKRRVRKPLEERASNQDQYDNNDLTILTANHELELRTDLEDDKDNNPIESVKPKSKKRSKAGTTSIKNETSKSNSNRGRSKLPADSKQPDKDKNDKTGVDTIKKEPTKRVVRIKQQTGSAIEASDASSEESTPRQGWWNRDDK